MAYEIYSLKYHIELNEFCSSMFYTTVNITMQSYKIILSHNKAAY